MAYSDKVIDHYENPRNVGSFDKNDPTVGTGMVGDYTREGLNEGFKFSNPNERDRCGCGESFAYNLVDFCLSVGVECHNGY